MIWSFVVEWIVFATIAVLFSALMLVPALMLVEKLRPHFWVKEDGPYGAIESVAVLIAAYNEETVIEDSVRAARACQLHGRPVDVYVVSNGCTDDTVDLARKAGAIVLEIVDGVGKPSALYQLLHRHGLFETYDAFAVVDADTIVAPDFIQEVVTPCDKNTAISVGKTLSNWSKKGAGRWNPFIASRAYSYETYQLVVRRIQAFFGVMNCISGSNSLLRSAVLEQVLLPETPVLVDDTWWTHATHREHLGNIIYAPKARAWVVDPTRLQSWYTQNLRWLHGTFQAMYQFHVFRMFTKFDFAYTILALNWVLYVISGPLALWLVIVANEPEKTVGYILAGYLVWGSVIALRLKRWEVIPLMPAIFLIDLIYRVVMVHALVRTIRVPRSAACVWQSPERYSLK